MKSVDRRQKILDLVAKERSQTVENLASYLEVSVATVRRDLVALNKTGRLIRTYGGARVGIPDVELTVAEKAIKYQVEKTVIARAAAEVVQDYETILIDAGTTTGYLAEVVSGQELTVITNSIAALSVLLQRREIKVTVLGGELRYINQALIGTSTIRQLRNLLMDRAFIGAYGIITGHGITSPTAAQAELKAVMMESAKHIYILADSSKFGDSPYKFITPIPPRSTIITDQGISPEIVQRLQQVHVSVLIGSG